VREVELRHGRYAAVATEVGGGLRLLTHEGRDLVVSFAADEARPRFRGALLAPWPNRVADGRYDFDGETHVLAVTEPERRAALHGLVCWERFDLEQPDPATAVAALALAPQPGYPFSAMLRASYRLGDDGLTTTVHVSNDGDRALPWGTGGHPYLVAGPGRVDDWVLSAPGTSVLEVDPDRLLPARPPDGGPRWTAVAGTDVDFTVARAIGATEVDHAFTDLRADDDGLARVSLRDPGTGLGAVLTWDPTTLPWLQLHTADLGADQPDADQSRRGLAVEPMTCPPDAFGSGVDVVVLEPGATHEVSWTLGALSPR
jgi:aldose 1-epimerase